MLLLAVGIVMLAAFVLVTWYEFGHTQGSFSERLFHAMSDSRTILVSRAVILWSIVLQLALAAGTLGNQWISDAVKAILKPEYVPAASVVIMLIVEVARRQGLPKKD